MTDNEISIENLDKKIEELLANQELLLKHLKLQSGRKLKGFSLREQVKCLTEQGYSIREISSMLKCSTTTVSTKRAEIKAMDSVEVQ
jgi:ATP/maltotriose-dependent transcriptional regulator MalT